MYFLIHVTCIIVYISTRWEVGAHNSTYRGEITLYTLPETNSSPLKMDGWNTIVSFSDGLFSGAMLVSESVTIKSPGYKIPRLEIGGPLPLRNRWAHNSTYRGEITLYGCFQK